MEIQCPVCGSDDAHHDGVQYVCEDCNNKWGYNGIFDDDDDDDYE